MTNHQFIIRFIKEYNLFDKTPFIEYIVKQSEEYWNKSNVWTVLNSVNMCCGWGGTGHRFKYEEMHLDITIFYFECYLEGLIECNFDDLKNYVEEKINNNIGGFFNSQNSCVINKLDDFIEKFNDYVMIREMF